MRDMTDVLYRQTKQTMESLSVEADHRQGGCDIELVQAWVLIAMYESMRARHQQAWMSAGRVFRLVQGMRFHEVDKTGTTADYALYRCHEEGNDLVKIEEQRRVFWMAYLLDHLMSLRNEWPITLNEHVV